MIKIFNTINRLNKMEQEIELFKQMFKMQSEEIKAIAREKALNKDQVDAIADLQVKMSKLWAVLIKVDTQGRERATSFAKKRYGGLSHRDAN